MGRQPLGGEGRGAGLSPREAAVVRRTGAVEALPSAGRSGRREAAPSSCALDLGPGLPLACRPVGLMARAVTGPGASSAAVLSGIGPAKGFGCGLLLVKRV